MNMRFAGSLVLEVAETLLLQKNKGPAPFWVHSTLVDTVVTILPCIVIANSHRTFPRIGGGGTTALKDVSFSATLGFACTLFAKTEESIGSRGTLLLIPPIASGAINTSGKLYLLFGGPLVGLQGGEAIFELQGHFGSGFTKNGCRLVERAEEALKSGNVSKGFAEGRRLHRLGNKILGAALREIWTAWARLQADFLLKVNRGINGPMVAIIVNVVPNFARAAYAGRCQNIVQNHFPGKHS
jgi:hypothetical protein